MLHDDPRSILQVLAHFLGNGTQADTREVVDCEARVLRVVQREHTPARGLNLWVLEPLHYGLQAHSFRHFGHHDFDENTATRRGVLLRQLDALHRRPRDRV